MNPKLSSLGGKPEYARPRPTVGVVPLEDAFEPDELDGYGLVVDASIDACVRVTRQMGDVSWAFSRFDAGPRDVGELRQPRWRDLTASKQAH